MDGIPSRTIFGATLGVLFLLFALVRRGKASRNEMTGELTFRYHTVARGIAYVALLLVPVLSWIALFVKPPKNTSDLTIIVVLVAGFTAAGGCLLWETKRYFLCASDTGLDCHSAWRRPRLLKWNEVRQISYVPANSWFIINTNDGWTFRISIFVSGVSQFLELAERHLTPKQLEEAKAGYAAVRRPFPGAAVDS